MELLQLRYFKLIAEEENMTKVAEKLHISQSALSKTIRTLEADLGYKLFDRVGRNIILNENGKIFLKYVKRNFQSLEDAQKELHDFNTIVQNEITLCVQAGLSMLPDIISGFNRKHPDIKFNITQKQLLNDLTISKYDFIIAVADIDEIPGKNTITLLEEELQLACALTHPLAARKSVDLSEVAVEPFISLPSYTKLRHTTDYYCQQAGFKPSILLECYDSNTILELVKNGMGICFLPKYTWKQINYEGIAIVNISEPKCSRRIILTWDADHYITKSAECFRDYIVDFFNHVSQSKQ
ncbi:LysR family transcriptional regulator [Acidaminobacter hydrogenoformans]|uniref:DNA-binding transcriptional regulator, LysR family n=1 Tax=Acidaminobacter hydrogenoformans DSM 2784 TaxID=1120920 RepID=A0A1G5S3X1_9FIRM|nr:LysR family transcriptional regulator [Acidaminobacter hydrogenoformans]SCZ81065.1 DNA-binding transcriptional regulator, LysR family [Acidaminobacter hydrogenoformans DSM 2784]